MVRRSYGKRRGTRKRSRYAKASSTKRIARIAKATVSRLSETKEGFYPYDNVGANSATFASFGYGASSTCASVISGITAGTSGSQRIGRKIFVRGIQVRFMMQPGDPYNNVRLLLVRQKGQANLSNNAVFVQEVLSGASSSGTQWANPVDTDLYTVLWDKIFTMRKLPADGSSSTTINQNKLINRFIKINKTFLFDTATTAMKDLWLIGISDSAAIANPGAIAGFVKVWFKDI